MSHAVTGMAFLCQTKYVIHTFSVTTVMTYDLPIVCFGFFFFFQAEDGIRDWSVTGVQTCALPISAGTPPAVTPASRGRMPPGGRGYIRRRRARTHRAGRRAPRRSRPVICAASGVVEIGRASCRERV